jgi:predicted transcriptional regulator of viral defense system
MEFNELYKTLVNNKYYIFSFEDILSFFPNEKKTNLKKLIYRWKKEGQIYSLKRGLYELTYPKDLIIPDLYIANKLYNPSYVSLETALSIFSIIPEVSMAVTSITTKSTRKFKNKHGLFTYHTVKSDIFTGYYVEKRGDFDVLIAEPEKALVDFIYFRTYRRKNYKFLNFIADERLDKNVMSNFKFKKIKNYAKLYNINLKGFYAHL